MANMDLSCTVAAGRGCTSAQCSKLYSSMEQAPRDQQALLQADMVSCCMLTGCSCATPSAMSCARLGCRWLAHTLARSPTSAKALCRTSGDASCYVVNQIMFWCPHQQNTCCTATDIAHCIISSRAASIHIQHCVLLCCLFPNKVDITPGCLPHVSYFFYAILGA